MKHPATCGGLCSTCGAFLSPAVHFGTQSPCFRTEVHREWGGAETIFLATGRDAVLERLRARANQHANDLVLTEQLAAEHFDSFEPPTVEEGALRVVGRGTS